MNNAFNHTATFAFAVQEDRLYHVNASPSIAEYRGMTRGHDGWLCLSVRGFHALPGALGSSPANSKKFVVLIETAPIAV